MPERSRGRPRPWSAIAAVALCAALIVIGALIWFVPFLTRSQGAVVSVAAPPALDAIAYFQLDPGEQACMGAVTITSNSELAQFQARPTKTSETTNPAIEMILSGPGYSSRSVDRAGAPGVQTQPLTPPAHTLIGQACFLDRGKRPVLMIGTGEPRTITRSPLTVAGKAITGDLMLLFFKRLPASIGSRLGEVFAHASNLTEGLVPVWLVWIVAVLGAFGVPVALLAAFYLALREEPPL